MSFLKILQVELSIWNFYKLVMYAYEMFESNYINLSSMLTDLHSETFFWKGGIFYQFFLTKVFVLESCASFFMIKSWFWTKKYSCKFPQKLIVKKLYIGSNLRELSFFSLRWNYSYLYLLNYQFSWKSTWIHFLFRINFYTILGAPIPKNILIHFVGL